jgi:NitT/TauT family transport system substrate-binding protein
MLRRTLLTLSLITATLGLFGCGKSSTSNGAASGTGAAKVKLQLNWVPEPEFGGFYAARESGAYAKNGLEVDIAGGGAGIPVVQMVAGGQADFGVAGADEILTARVRGADIVPIFAVYQTSPQCLMAHASRNANSISELLSSGTVALEPGLPYAAYLKKKYGFDKAKIVPYDGGVARFLTDKDFAQQCFVTSEPIAAAQKGVESKVFLVADEGYNPYLAVVITRRALVREQPERVKAFLRATREGWKSYLENPAHANGVMGKLNTSMTPETFAAAAAKQKPLIETAETTKSGLGSMSQERWEKLGSQLVELGIVPKAPPTSDYLVSLD